MNVDYVTDTSKDYKEELEVYVGEDGRPAERPGVPRRDGSPETFGVEPRLTEETGWRELPGLAG